MGQATPGAGAEAGTGRKRDTSLSDRDSISDPRSAQPSPLPPPALQWSEGFLCGLPISNGVWVQCARLDRTRIYISSGEIDWLFSNQLFLILWNFVYWCWCESWLMARFCVEYDFYNCWHGVYMYICIYYMFIPSKSFYCTNFIMFNNADMYILYKQTFLLNYTTNIIYFSSRNSEHSSSISSSSGSRSVAVVPDQPRILMKMLEWNFSSDAVSWSSKLILATVSQYNLQYNCIGF